MTPRFRRTKAGQFGLWKIKHDRITPRLEFMVRSLRSPKGPLGRILANNLEIVRQEILNNFLGLELKRGDGSGKSKIDIFQNAFAMVGRVGNFGRSGATGQKIGAGIGRLSVLNQAEMRLRRRHEHADYANIRVFNWMRIMDEGTLGGKNARYPIYSSKYLGVRPKRLMKFKVGGAWILALKVSHPGFEQTRFFSSVAEEVTNRTHPACWRVFADLEKFIAQVAPLKNPLEAYRDEDVEILVDQLQALVEETRPSRIGINA